MVQEIDRIKNVSSFALDYDGYQQELRPFVELAKKITDSSVCEINIIDAYNQWTISRAEEELKVIPKEQSVCFDTIQQQEPYEISDLQQEDRYKKRNYVSGDPYFRYYCGVQLTTKKNKNIGSICVLDHESKEISDVQKRQLEHLADLVVQYLEKDRSVYQAEKQVHTLKERFKTLNHDLRSPLNGIIGIVELLKGDEQKVSVLMDDLTVIKDCAEAIVEEVDEVMVSEMDSRESANGTGSSMLNQVFLKVESLSLPQAKNKNINLSIDYIGEHDRPISVYTSKQLVQILNNLVANAIKFTDSSGEVKVTNEVYREDEQEFLKVRVEDNGIGMADKEVEKFNSGKKVTGSLGTDGEASFGIGLEHVRDMVSELKGQITVDSAEGEGTIFTVTVALTNL